MAPKICGAVALALLATTAMSDTFAPETLQLTAEQMDAVTAGLTITVTVTSTGQPTSMAEQLAAEDATRTRLLARRAYILELKAAAESEVSTAP
jgi:hypothetical protein